MKAIWTTKAGERIPVKDLSESHLVNILKLYSKQNTTLAIYTDHKLNIKQLENILLNGKFTVCNVKKELLEWVEDKIIDLVLEDLSNDLIPEDHHNFDPYLDEYYDNITECQQFLDDYDKRRK